ncbi:diacylglycerol O-acyltransferase 2A [Cucurbitaria berberidis CBS 394.84]|uniref:Diacylglycerol O-acyltransferase n=1 Tax=Cucurbitaria berberidis CBS 394.84 TaxID=1168544 RepID=A0A9P4GI35_9PLEO|nr:diacylglycerol O-acyltransferase 2A [Cucurbitaria berberidis CBS 394.84]KAF1846000.1 diacylglycerol O-acyltransferase 2A [Cucurbitaria berberidis CBS 394.84]
MSLNPEPSAPEERAGQDLPPKTYANAAEEALEPESHANHTDGTLEHAGRRVRDKAEQVKANGIKIPSAEDKDSLEGVGLDSSPKSPTVKGHRRGGSRSSPARKRGEHTENGLYEKHQNGHGDALTTVKPSLELDKGARTDALKRRNSELKSGRQAGAGWARSKIRFAPMNVPLQRRLQTLAVLMHTLSIVGGLAIFFFLCSIPVLWPILLPYTVYVLFSNAGTSGELSLRSERLRRLPVWSLFASYFPARLHRSQELEPTRKYIFGYHPHGIISHGAFAAFATEALGFSQLFPGITNALLTLDSNFRYPIYREYALRLGMASVSRESCENLLSKGGTNGEGMGRAITIVVGGASESLDARPGIVRLVLRRRKGFVKMAIRTGADLVPVLAFGENDIYDQLDTESHPYIHKFQLLVKKVMGFTIPIFHARGIFNYDVGMMPYRRPINIVVGRPIRVVQDKHPDAEYLDEVHEKYISELMRLWEEHKDTFAKQRTGELEIVE